MKRRYLLNSIFSLMLAMTPVSAMAGIDDLPVTTVNGRSYHYYDVAPKQTVYSICRALGITKEQLVASNPSVAEEGLKAFQRLLFPVNGEPVAATAASSAADRKIHVAASRETIYSIARAYGVTPSKLEQWNPGLRERGVREGDRIVVSDAPAASESAGASEPAGTTQAATPGYTEYVVKDKETFYSIAHTHGVSVAALEEANPDVALLREGMKLRIPASTTTADHPSLPAPIEVKRPDPSPQPVVLPDPVRVDSIVPSTPEAVTAPAPASKDVNIAVVLPFMLGEEQRGRRAELMTEWYKGFLIAVDSMRASERPIHITAFDSRGADNSLDNILSDPRLAEASVIIAPDNARQLDALATWAAPRGIDVMNLFVVADRTYTDTPSLYQATIPHDDMYRQAIEAMLTHFRDGITPVIVSPEGADGDKKEFVSTLTSRLRNAGIEYLTIGYNGSLTASDLAALDRTGRYAFIPVSSRQADLNRILPSLIELKTQMTSYDPIRLYGYPEWTTFRGETLSNMHALNTYVYSRFFTSPDDPWAKRVEEAYERWYGEPMAAAVPRQGLLGFDTGMFLVKVLSGGDTLANAPVYHGVQNAFRFVSPAGVKGHVNDDLYFVNFRPSGLTDRISL